MSTDRLVWKEITMSPIGNYRYLRTCSRSILRNNCDDLTTYFSIDHIGFQSQLEQAITTTGTYIRQIKISTHCNIKYCVGTPKCLDCMQDIQLRTLRSWGNI